LEGKKRANLMSSNLTWKEGIWNQERGEGGIRKKIIT